MFELNYALKLSEEKERLYYSAYSLKWRSYTFVDVSAIIRVAIKSSELLIKHLAKTFYFVIFFIEFIKSMFITNFIIL